MMQIAIDWTALPPVSHANDPKTAKKAAKKAESFRVTHAQIVLNGVQKNPCLTALELAALLHMGEYQDRRRLSDLKALGQVAIVGEKEGNSTWAAR